MTSNHVLQSAWIGVCEGMREQKGLGPRSQGPAGQRDGAWGAPRRLGTWAANPRGPGAGWGSERRKTVNIIQVKKTQGQKQWSTGHGFLFVLL